MALLRLLLRAQGEVILFASKAAAAMQAVGTNKDLMDMKVTELKAELEARGEVKTGNKAWLRRRLRVCTPRSCATI